MEQERSYEGAWEQRRELQKYRSVEKRKSLGITVPGGWERNDTKNSELQREGRSEGEGGESEIV